MIWGIAMLLLGAALVMYGAWRGRVRWEYLQHLARQAGVHDSATDPWEEPKIVATYGGIHDVEEDQWL